MNTAQTAAIIKTLCKSKGYPISMLLLECGIRKSLIYDMEKRDCIPAADVLERIAECLDCSVDYLLGRTEVPEVNRGQLHIVNKNDTEFAQDITPEPPTPTLADYGKIAADDSEFTRTANIKKPKTTLYDD